MNTKINVGQDFLESVKGHKVVCFEISVSEKKFTLKKGYTKAEFHAVVKEMLHCDREFYDLSGIIWCKKAIWLEVEYDEMGNAHWTERSCPKIPESLL